MNQKESGAPMNVDQIVYEAGSEDPVPKRVRGAKFRAGRKVQAARVLAILRNHGVSVPY